MAEIIIRLKDNFRPGQSRAEFSYRPGDIVDILEDGIAEGCKKVGPPNFAVVKVPGVSVEALREYMIPDCDDDNDENSPMRNRRRFNVETARMTGALRGKLQAARGSIMLGNRGPGPRQDDMTVDDFVDLMRNRRTGQTEKQRGVTDATWRGR